MTEKNELTKIKDAVFKSAESSKKEKICKCGDYTANEDIVCDTCKFLDERNKTEKSLILQLFGDTPKSRILDFLIANKGQSFSKTEISRGAHVFKTAFFKQNQSKHYYNYFGDLMHLGVVKAVSNGGRAPKYALNMDNKVVRRLLKLELALFEDSVEQAKLKEVVDE